MMMAMRYSVLAMSCPAADTRSARIFINRSEMNIRSAVSSSMKPYIVALILGLLATPPAMSGEFSQVIFEPSGFADIGYIVQIGGTLTGEGVPHKNNRSILTCYQKIQLCSEIDVNASGMQVFTIGPSLFDVRSWTPDHIIADYAAPCGGNDTWIIDRKRKSAELVDHPCLEEAKTYHWTIKNPPFWEKRRNGD